MARGRVRIGDFRVDLERRQVFAGDQPVELSWKAFQALTVLMEADGELVERERLLSLLWPGVHVEESSLNQCISQLRKAFGTNSTGSSLIETVPRRGYRLACPATPEPAAGDARRPDRHRWRRFVASVISVLLLAAAAAGSWSLWVRYSTQREALRLAQDGIAELRRTHRDEIPDAVLMLERSIQLSPGLALGYAGLAEAMARSGMPQPNQPGGFAEKAVRMDAQCVECRAILGWIRMTREWKWEEARAQLESAVQERPADARMRLWWAQYLATQRRMGEARKQIDIAAQLEPANAGVLTMRAGILYLSGHYEDAIAEARRALGIDFRHQGAWEWIYRSQALLNRHEEALNSLESADSAYIGLSADAVEQRSLELIRLYGSGGLREVVGRLLKASSSPAAREERCYDRATWRMWLNDREGALAELENAFEFHPFQMIYLAADPMFDGLHSEKRFQRLLERVGLSTQPESMVFKAPDVLK